MHLALDIYDLLPALAFLVAVILIQMSWKYRKSRLGITLLVLMSALAWWSFAAIMERNSVDLAVKYFWVRMTYFGIVGLPATWLVFALKYTDHEKWLTRRNSILLFIIPAVTLVMVWTNDIHHLMWGSIWLDTSVYPAVDAVTHGIWFWISAAYAYILLLVGTLLVFKIYLKSSANYRKQSGTLLLAAIIPWIGNVLFLAGVGPFAKADPTPLAFAITGVAFFFGMSRLQLIDIMPVAHETILKSMIDGVIVLDDQGRIVEINPAAERIIGGRRAEIIGQTWSHVLPIKEGLSELKSETAEKQTTIELGKDDIKRHYGVYVSSLRIRRNLDGSVIILHDETERQKAESEARARAVLETELVERQRAQEKLAKSEEKYSTIVEKGNDGIIIMRDGIIKFVNSKMTEMTGYSLEESLGRPFLEFVSQDHQASTAERHQKRISGEEISSKSEISILTKQGGAIAVEINANLIEYEGSRSVMAMVRDIRERKRAEAILKASEAKFRNLVENAAAGIVNTLANGRVLSANKAAQEIYGFETEEEMLGASMLERYVEPEDRKRMLDIVQKEGVAKGFETRMRRQDGRMFWASLNVIVQKVGTGPKQFVAIVEDITNRKDAEAELIRLNEQLRSFGLRLEARVEERTLQLEEAVQIAKASDQAKSEFLASMSHELRTPLNAIIGFSQVLEARYFGNLNEKQEEYVNDILESGRHLLSLINDILDLSKIEAGKMELEISRVKAADILRNSLVMIKEKALAHNISVEVKIEAIEDLAIMADERKLKQVMYNLLSNATKFTPDGGRIVVESSIGTEGLLVSIKDSGIGISAKEQARLFEAFYQASGGIKGKTPGTGLGLKITKSIVEQHGGRIWVDSEGTGKGQPFFLHPACES